MINRFRPPTIFFAALLTLSMTAASSDAGFVVSLDNSDLTATRVTASSFTHSIDLLVTQDDTGDTTLSGITVDVTVQAPLSLNANDSPVNPLGFAQADISVSGSVAFSNFVNIALVADSTNQLTTLDITVPGTATDGLYNIQLSIFDALRGGATNPVDISDEFTSMGGSLNVVTVPEPAYAACLVGAMLGFGCLRRRRG